MVLVGLQRVGTVDREYRIGQSPKFFSIFFTELTEVERAAEGHSTGPIK